MLQSKINGIPSMPAFNARIRKILKFQLWIWCILWFISLPSTSGKCGGVDISISIYPKEHNILYGEPLELFCVAGSNYSASDIFIMKDGKKLESEIVNSTTRRLYIAKPEKQFATYSCHNLKNNKRCISRIVVDNPPSDVTDFNCFSKNLESLNCSWTSPKAYSVVSYKLNFYVHNNLVSPPCEPFSFKTTRYCVWDSSTLPRYRQQDEKQHFYLSSCNIFGCNNQNFTIDHFSIVKPDPPYDLGVFSNGAHNVLLKWRIPHNIADLLQCGVDYKIQYQIAKVDNRTHFRTVDTLQLPAKPAMIVFNIDLPYAHMQYEVRIYIKSKLAVSEEFWSDYTFLVFTTLAERPIRPPKMIAGAFDQNIVSNNERVINIYWQNIEEIEEAGPEFTYKVQVSDGDTTNTIYPANGKSYVTFKTSLDALDVYVWSANINGSSENRSFIYIPPEKDTRNLKINSLRKVAYENGTYELWWDDVKDVDNYTLFWCKHNGDQTCSGRIEFAVLDSRQARHVIDLPKDDVYQFAVSANRGVSSGGMTWAKIYGSQVGDRIVDCVQRGNY
ncbi:cytokine receptor-like [Bicyclus anynana]|uniref:Cytokine receptor-like n=1 Tax=Bicyclus anynana TaxID=110368 RepID=A0ABM3LNG7_BICAN|nr:cytokine receptor-like [Bicyclus anynana]